MRPKDTRKRPGKPGVVLVTSGPGATNTVTGIADAYMDSIPLVVFTGQVPLRLIGNDAFQEADIVGITRPITKHNYLVRDVSELAQHDQGGVLHRHERAAGTGARRSSEGRHGAEDALRLSRHSVELRSYNADRGRARRSRSRRPPELINEAKRPVLYVGGGAILSDAAPRS